MNVTLLSDMEVSDYTANLTSKAPLERYAAIQRKPKENDFVLAISMLLLLALYSDQH